MSGEVADDNFNLFQTCFQVYIEFRMEKMHQVPKG